MATSEFVRALAKEMKITICYACGKEIKGGMRLFKIGNDNYCLDCWEGKK